MDLALNNLQWLICHKAKPNPQKYISHGRVIVIHSLLIKEAMENHDQPSSERGSFYSLYKFRRTGLYMIYW